MRAMKFRAWRGISQGAARSDLRGASVDSSLRSEWTSRYDRQTLSNNVVIVGGGIAGLAASIYLARGGRTVTVFEKRQYLGGRAVTHLRHGYRFNLGPHAFYRGGEGSTVLAELGIPVRGGVPKKSGLALYGNERYR